MTTDDINSPETLFEYFDNCLTGFERGYTNRDETLAGLLLAVGRIIEISRDKENKAVGEALLSNKNFKKILDAGDMHIIAGD